MKKDKLGYFFLVITVVLFSTYEAVGKTLSGQVNPFQINFLRFLAGGVLLFLILLIKGDIKISLKEAAYVTLAGLINVVVSMNLLQQALISEGAKASIVAVIFSSNPIFVTVFSALFERQKIGFAQACGLLLGFAGIIVISVDTLDFSGINIVSPVLALLSAVFYGLYTVIGRMVSLRIGSLKMNAYSFISGSLMLIPIMLALKVPILHFSPEATLKILYLGIFVTGIAYYSYFIGLTSVGAGSGSMVFFLKPVLASIIAAVFLGESITMNMVAGTILIIAGIASIVMKNKIKEKFSRSLQDFANK